MRVAPAYSGCQNCQKMFGESDLIQNARCSINPREKYLARRKVKVTFGYNRSEIEKVIPDLSERQSDILDKLGRLMHPSRKPMNHLEKAFAKEQLVMKEQKGGGLSAEHISPIIWNNVKTRIFSNIIFCPDERLQIYKEKPIPDYIASKDLTASEQSKIIEFMREVVDPKMIDIHHSLNLVRDVEDQQFTTAISEQGSGVKSVFCLMSDILFERQTRLLLIDEPELGLNPTGKHAFLKFLIEQSKDKQVFLATHDPTFVNPILWNKENTSVYLYSIATSEFVKVNLDQSKHDPNTFAGYLPHTTSLRQIHIYVEGTYDVYIFQAFLNKYVRKRFKEDWYRILSRIGIFHLGGDFWSHLLYTVPKPPYTSMVILDGDKRKTISTVIQNYSKVEKDRFRLYDSDDIQELRRMRNGIPCPIYCLGQENIELYLETEYETLPLFKEHGPRIADEMKSVPPENREIVRCYIQSGRYSIIDSHMISIMLFDF